MASATAGTNALMEVRNSSCSFVFAFVISISFEKILISVQGYCSNVTSKCVCSSGYGGLMCELDINECATHDRICGSYICINLPGDYKCECDFFRSGKQCQNSNTSYSFFFLAST